MIRLIKLLTIIIYIERRCINMPNWLKTLLTAISAALGAILGGAF